MSECNCRLCTEHRRQEEILASRDVDKISDLARQLAEAFMYVDEDKCYLQAVVDGSWGETSDAVIKAYRESREAGQQKMREGMSALPPLGEPTGGFRFYTDCGAGSSVLCNRPDCTRCHKSRLHGTRSKYIELLAVISFLSNGRTLPKAAQDIVDHFNPKLNAHAAAFTAEAIRPVVARIEASHG